MLAVLPLLALNISRRKRLYPLILPKLWLNTSEENEKKAKKLKTLAEKGCCDINNVLEIRRRPKMAAQPDPHYSSSDGDLLNAPNKIHQTEGLISSHQEKDVDIIHENISVVTARVQAKEDNISSIQQKQTGTNELVLQLQASHKAMQVRINTLDDAQKRNNLNIIIITESIDEHELPHLLKRLFTTFLPQLFA
ncbi:Hypothetical predicted protein [Pelobates cultripes]|uniref:Uncharacterized protein n=1 Tax=Pelobates cultripes TaxID=61616 RepID=A0AAD1RHA9_PELCU|nr:Hypothetical predicted protein [Pelobates cultripes]